MPRTGSLRNAAWLALLCALTVLGWWLPNRPQNPDAGVRIEKFNSLSYAPYRPGQSPLADRFATAAEVDEDLGLLAPRTRAIRTYAAIEGPYDLPALAQKHGLKVWQGIWLGGDRARNQLEMARAIEMAHRYPDTIERVTVGNEVLLRRDLPVAELIADIDHVRAAVKQPVAYADVSDFWDQFPQVAPHVDIVLIHLLPYWEDVPTGIDHAVATVGAVYQHFVRLFPGRKIAIGETGWPSRGRQRRDALPSRINEARFLRDFIALSQASHFDYNFIEAFDQDWKYESEGIVGANWGILSADRSAKIPTSGPLREDPLWARHAAFSITCALILLCLTTCSDRCFKSPLPFFNGAGWVRGFGAARQVLPGSTPLSFPAGDAADAVSVASEPKIGEGDGRYVTVGNKEFVALEDGSPDLGQISPEIAGSLNIEAAPIRLPRDADNGLGEIHITTGSRPQQLADAGFADPAAFVLRVASNYSEIWSARGRSMLLVHRVPAGQDGAAHTLVVRLEPAADGSAYEVKTAGIFSGSYPGGGARQLLWQRASATSPSPKPATGAPSEAPSRNEAGTGGAGVSDQSVSELGAAGAAVKNAALLAAALGVALGIAQADAAPVLFDTHVRLAAVVNLGGQALLAGLMMLRASGALPAAPDRTGADATRRILALLRLQPYPWRGLFEDLCFLFAWTAAVLQILLVFDPRYREFPLASFAVPLVVLAARFARNDFAGESPGGREEILVAATLVVGALASAIQEGVLNGQSLRWNACALLLSLPLWLRSSGLPSKKAPPAIAV